MEPKSVFLIRHGTPDWNRRDIRYDIPPGPGLVDKGRDEARLAGGYLRQLGVTRLFCSPMDRAVQTAAEISEVLHLPVSRDVRLTEWTRDEKEPDVLRRMRSFWAEQIQGTEDGPVILVTHGGPIQAVITHFAPDLDLKPYLARFERRTCAPPGGIWRATQTAPGEPWQLALVFIPEMAGQLC